MLSFDDKTMLHRIISNQHLMMRALMNACPDKSMQETLRKRMAEMEKDFSWLSPHSGEPHSKEDEQAGR